MANYVYDLSKDSDFSVFLKEINDISKLFKSMEFKSFIADKCLKELDLITASKLGSFDEHDVFNDKVELYKRNNKYKLGNDYILIYNDTTLYQEEMYWVSEKTKANYPEGISISYIIEYGTGIMGDSQDDWKTNVNNHHNSWSYKKDDKIYHTSGISGRYIYKELLEKVELNFEKWVLEYIEKKER